MNMVKEARRLMKDFGIASRELEAYLTLDEMLKQSLIAQILQATSGTPAALAVENALDGLSEKGGAVLDRLAGTVPSFSNAIQFDTFTVVARGGQAVKGAWKNGAPAARTANSGSRGTVTGLSASETIYCDRVACSPLSHLEYL
jgi:hypothetical protein